MSGIFEGLGFAFEPLVPWIVIGILGLIGALILILSHVLKAPGSWLRSLAYGAILLALSNPSAILEEREKLKDVAVIVVDESPSQQFGSRQAQATSALAQVQEALKPFEEWLDVRVINVAHNSVKDAEDGTSLIDPLRQSLADTPSRQIAGAILITDGRIHDLPTALSKDLGVQSADQTANQTTELQEALNGLIDAPIHTLLTGNPDEQDRRLVILESPSFGLVGESVTVRLRVEDAQATGDSARVTIRADGTYLKPSTVTVGAVSEIEIPIERRGATVVELETGSHDKEITDQNNKAVLSINGVRDRLRVLLVSGEPHPGERIWRNLLKSDPSVDLVHFTILRPPEKQDGTPIHELSLIAFPTRQLFEVKLQDFDLIVFDRFRRRGVLPSLYISNIVDYIEQGGAFLEAVGPSFAGPYSLYRTPIGRIMPGEPTGAVISRGFTPNVTELGKRHPVTAALPGGPLGSDGEPRWGRWFRQVEVDQISGNTLMSGVNDSPLLILDRVGEGRVGQFLSDHIWLWARGVEGGGPQRELLRRLAHWLMKEPDLEEEDLLAEVTESGLVITRRTIEETIEPVIVDGPNGFSAEVALARDRRGSLSRGSFEGILPITQAGVYRVSHGRLSTLVAAGSLNPIEFSAVTATDAIALQLAEGTGGGVYWLEEGIPALRAIQPDRVAAGSSWIGLRENGDYIVRGISTAPLAPPLFALLVLIGLLAAAWRREAR